MHFDVAATTVGTATLPFLLTLKGIAVVVVDVTVSVLVLVEVSVVVVSLAGAVVVQGGPATVAVATEPEPVAVDVTSMIDANEEQKAEARRAIKTARQFATASRLWI